MFENKGEKTNLIIVCDEKLTTYANLLMGLLGQNDDVDGRIVGTEDNSVSAAIWTPKVYKDSLPKIPSNNPILFIGNFKEAKEQRESINIKFNKYGMQYGWLGNRAVMYVENKTLKKDEYEQFIAFSKEYQKEFKKVKAINQLPKEAKRILSFIPWVYPVGIYGLIADKKIMKQQYTCLTMVLYLDGLHEFLEG